jgi:nicotinic acid mononucleotide adenylyltransferase
LCHDDINFSELLINVVDSDEYSNYDSMMAELEFISNATIEEIVDKFCYDDCNDCGADVLLHFRNEDDLTNKMLGVLGRDAANYITDFNDIQKLNVNPFIESLIDALMNR